MHSTVKPAVSWLKKSREDEEKKEACAGRLEGMFCDVIPDSLLCTCYWSTYVLYSELKNKTFFSVDR
jgi:hypothetical protein